MKIKAERCWVFGDDLNTDVIHPPTFFSLDPEIVKLGLFHGYDPTLQPSLTPGDVLIGGSNFGCGSSRETSIRSLQLNGIGCIVAVSFARIFFRNATNNGLPCVTFASARDKTELAPGEPIEVDLEAHQLRTAGARVIELAPTGEFIQKIWRAGGLLGLLP
jgi:3-isopropylmalate/(R)-2-methylmalate dehydratase small subunit